MKLIFKMELEEDLRKKILKPTFRINSIMAETFSS